MSFQRTRMSADRTLMSVIRTALSLIGFGFTIFQVFRKAQDANLVAASNAPVHFGTALVALGILSLVVGIGYHVTFMLELRRERADMTNQGLIHGRSGYPYSMTLGMAVILLVLGIMAIASMIFHVGPFD